MNANLAFIKRDIIGSLHSHLVHRNFDKFDIISTIFKIRWHITSWETCTKSCGNGTQVRQLYCAVDTNIKGRLRVNNDQCTDKKPTDALSRICNEVMCPATWDVGPWSVVGSLLHKYYIVPHNVYT